MSSYLLPKWKKLGTNNYELQISCDKSFKIKLYKLNFEDCLYNKKDREAYRDYKSTWTIDIMKDDMVIANKYFASTKIREVKKHAVDWAISELDKSIYELRNELDRFLYVSTELEIFRDPEEYESCIV